MLSLMAIPAMAQTVSGTIGAYTLDPPEGQVEEISKIKVTFPDLGFALNTSIDCSDVKLASGAGTVYDVVKTNSFFDNFCEMTFGIGGEAVTVTAPGEYTLTIPEGIFKDFDNASRTNGPITAVYTIKGVESNSLTDYRLTPADGGVTGVFLEVTITFPDAADTGVTPPEDMSVITLTADGVTYVCVSATQPVSGTVAMRFATAAGEEPCVFSRPGQYTLSVPKNVFTATGTDETNDYRVEATFTLENPGFDPMAEVVTTPAMDAVLDSFTEIDVRFPGADKGLDFPSDLSGVKLSIDGQPTGYVAGNVTMRPPYDSVSFSFSDSAYGSPVTFGESGTYAVSIPAGVFRESGSGDYVNEAIDLVFKVQDPDSDPFGNWSCEPASGSTVGEIYRIVISFPELEESRIQWPFDISRLTLQRIGDETVYTGNTATLQGGCNVTTGFGPEGAEYSDMLRFCTAGEYEVTVPAGTFASEADPSVTNKEIRMRFTVDPAYNFTYKLTPDPAKALASLPEILMAPDDALISISLADLSGNKGAMLINGDEEVELSAVADDQGVRFTPLSPVGVGEWTLSIPAGFLAGVGPGGLDLVNALPIEAVYTVKKPQEYTYGTTPAEGGEVAVFTKYTVNVKGSPKKVTVDKEAGVPMLSGQGVSVEMASSVSGADVMFAPKGGAALADGTYTVTVPAGYIVTTDRDGLQATLPEIRGSFKVAAPVGADFSTGMMLYNEGWYGHDMASFTHMGEDGTVTYNAFMGENPDKSLGLTGTCAVRFGDKLYAVSKQSGMNLNGAQGGILTQMDGFSLAYIDQIYSLEGSEQGRAFCGFDADKGYLSTNKGVYPVDLKTMTAGERISATQSMTLQYGEMLRYGGRMFVVAKNWDLITIDPVSDSMLDIETGPAVKCFVTPDGSMYVATLVEGSEFVRLDPVSLALKKVDVNAGDYTGRLRIANIWNTWVPAPLAVDVKDNVVYYATETNATSVARLDLDSGEFTPDFITLPSVGDVQQCLYGQGISVDPATGHIVLTAVEKGFGTHYTQNYVYRADPATGLIDEEKTVKLSEDYWFPSMVVYSGFKAPELSLGDISLADGPVVLDLREHTTLALGNVHEVEYTVCSSDSRVCSVKELVPGMYELTSVGEGVADITVTADFMGLRAQADFVAGTSGIAAVDGDATLSDVYTPDGVLVLKGASSQEIRNLPAGLYIASGKKIYVRP